MNATGLSVPSVAARNALVEWANFHLLKLGSLSKTGTIAHWQLIAYKISKLDTDLEDGIKLWRLFELLAGQPPMGGQIDAKERLKLCLNALHERGASIGPSDVVVRDWSASYAVDVLWAMAEFVHLESVVFEEFTGRVALLEWVRRKSGVAIPDFSVQAWKDGSALEAVLCECDAELAKELRREIPSAGDVMQQSRLDRVLEVIDERLGIPTFFAEADLSETDAVEDERPLVVLLLTLFTVLVGPPSKEPEPKMEHEESGEVEKLDHVDVGEEKQETHEESKTLSHDGLTVEAHKVDAIDDDDAAGDKAKSEEQKGEDNKSVAATEAEKVGEKETEESKSEVVQEKDVEKDVEKDKPDESEARAEEGPGKADPDVADEKQKVTDEASAEPKPMESDAPAVKPADAETTFANISTAALPEKAASEGAEEQQPQVTSVREYKVGVLTKRGGRIKTWKTRLFRLTEQSLTYGKVEWVDQKPICGVIKGTIPSDDICSVEIGSGSGKAFNFSIILHTALHHHAERLECRAESVEERKSWITAVASLVKGRARALREQRAKGAPRRAPRTPAFFLQRKVYTQWANHLLASRRVHVNDVMRAISIDLSILPVVAVEAMIAAAKGVRSSSLTFSSSSASSTTATETTGEPRASAGSRKQVSVLAAGALQLAASLATTSGAAVCRVRQEKIRTRRTDHFNRVLSFLTLAGVVVPEGVTADSLSDGNEGRVLDVLQAVIDAFSRVQWRGGEETQCSLSASVDAFVEFICQEYPTLSKYLSRGLPRRNYGTFCCVLTHFHNCSLIAFQSEFEALVSGALTEEDEMDQQKTYYSLMNSVLEGLDENSLYPEELMQLESAGAFCMLGELSRILTSKANEKVLTRRAASPTEKEKEEGKIEGSTVVETNPVDATMVEDDDGQTEAVVVVGDTDVEHEKETVKGKDGVETKSASEPERTSLDERARTVAKTEVLGEDLSVTVEKEEPGDEPSHSPKVVADDVREAAIEKESPSSSFIEAIDANQSGIRSDSDTVNASEEDVEEERNAVRPSLELSEDIEVRREPEQQRLSSPLPSPSPFPSEQGSMSIGTDETVPSLHPSELVQVRETSDRGDAEDVEGTTDPRVDELIASLGKDGYDDERLARVHDFVPSFDGKLRCSDVVKICRCFELDFFFKDVIVSVYPTLSESEKSSFFQDVICVVANMEIEQEEIAEEVGCVRV